MKAEHIKASVDCAVKIIPKSKIQEHQILIDLMQNELKVLQTTVSTSLINFIDTPSYHEDTLAARG